MTGAVYEQDDNVGSSHDADVDAAYDDDQPAGDLATGAEGVIDNVGGLAGAGDLEGAGGESHAADQAAGYDDK